MSDAENLEIKKRARRRLVGAVTLALLAAVVLPMVMDQEPHPAVQDIQITIPDREAAGGARRSAPADDTQAQAAAVPIPEDEALAASEKPVAPVAEPPAKAAPEVAAVAPPARASTPTPPPAQPPAPARSEPPPPLTRSAEEEARVKAILSGQVVPPRGEGFVIQVGAFSDAAKASRLADDLKAKGFQAYTERAGNVTRVRVGPIAGRAAADAAVSRLKAAGHQGVIQPR